MKLSDIKEDTQPISSLPSDDVQRKPGGPLVSNPVIAGLSTAGSSALFGLPELVATKGFGSDYFETLRQQSPTASLVGDVAGLVSPATIGYKALSKGIGLGVERLLGKGAGKGPISPDLINDLKTSLATKQQELKTLTENPNTTKEILEKGYHSGIDSISKDINTFSNTIKGLENVDLAKTLETSGSRGLKWLGTKAAKLGGGLLGATAATATTGGVQGYAQDQPIIPSMLATGSLPSKAASAVTRAVIPGL